MYQTYSRRAGYVFGFIYMFYKYNKHRKKEVQEKRQLSYLQQITTLKETFSIPKISNYSYNFLSL